MELALDLHLHSPYARAVSKRMTLEEIAAWALRKGVDVVGTGDFTHPLWCSQLKRELCPKEKGLFSLKKKGYSSVRFLLSTEISCVYQQDGRGRRIHLLVFAPSFQTLEKVNRFLAKGGVNLSSDGRPTVFLSAASLVKNFKFLDENLVIIPAHIWTPWFSLYGSRSGFTSLEACFGKEAHFIKAVETGLSSDPEMNWPVKELFSRQLVSFSDAHSPENIGREMTILKGEKDLLSFSEVMAALEGRGRGRIASTIEFYPQEGKYHYTGHRRCQISYPPRRIEKIGKICPVCGRPLTVGVADQVALQAQKENKIKKEEDKYGVSWIKSVSYPKRPPFIRLVPLMEILSEVLSVGVKAQKVKNEYIKLTSVLGSEREILTKRKTEEISKVGGEKLAQAIIRVRKGEVFVNPGFDGQFGQVKIFSRSFSRSISQEALF